MKITVLGATGKVGDIIVGKLLEQGHEVCVFVHSSPKYDTNAAVRVVKGDIHDAALVDQAIAGSEVVMSALGSWNTPTKDILSSAMSLAVPAMQKYKVKRLISLTGSGANAPGDTITPAGKISHGIFSLIAKKIITDAERHLQLLQASDLDWTVLRASVMTGGNSKSYRLNQKLPSAWETIDRVAVAQAMVDQLKDANYYRRAPHIHRN